MISKDKTYRTRDGREVRIYATDAGLRYSIHGATKSYDGSFWVQCEWMPDGRVYECRQDRNDLIEVKPRIRRTVWLNVYEHGGVYAVTDPINKGEQCIACVKVEIDCEEGEGL